MFVLWLVGAAIATVSLSLSCYFYFYSFSHFHFPLSPTPTHPAFFFFLQILTLTHTHKKKKPTNKTQQTKSYWGNLHWCQTYLACRVLTALVAFSWMGSILLFALLLISLMFAVANRAFAQPLHGRYDPRGSGYGPGMAQRRV